MFWMVIYFAVAYSIVGVISLFLLLRRGPSSPRTPASGRVAREVRHTRRKVLGTIALFLLPLLPYALVAIQTWLMLPFLRPALMDAVHDEWGAGINPRIVRVLRPFPSPKVYVVVPCHGMGNDGEVGCLYSFDYVGGHWTWDGVPDVAWSECGSADGNTFPPYPEASEF